MQIGKAGAVAAGALAAVTVIGSAAAAAPAGEAVGTAATKLEVDRAARQGVPPPQPLITIGVGSSIMAAPWQACGSSAVWGVGGVGTSGVPHTVLGDCANANVVLQQDQVHGVISILDDTSVNVLPWQVCGSHVVGGVGVNVAANSPATVTGDCLNANTKLAAPDGTGPSSLLAVGSGAVINVVPWQVCGSTAVMGLGAVANLNSPTAVLGDCTNANITHEPRLNPADIPVLSGTDLNLLPLQICEQDGLVSLVGLVLPLGNSDAFVGGECT